MLGSMSARELRTWELYEVIEPFGERAAYWRAGMIAATIANVNRAKKDPAFKPEDFMPSLFGESRPVPARKRAALIVERFKLIADRERVKKH